MSRARALIRWWGVVPVVLAIGVLALRACVHVDPRARLGRVPAEVGDPPGTVAEGGSLAVTRGGPVIVGFVADGVGRLTIAGHELRGRGVVKERIVLPAGPIALRFAAPREAQLVWSPVGRRGDPEYLPASSLSDQPPAAATFDAPGTARTDGVLALALLAIVTGSALMLARRRLATVSRASWLAMAAVFAVAVIVRWIDLGGFGETWDEGVNWAAGRNYVTNLLALDLRARSWQWNYEHPPVMKYLEGIGAQLADGFGPARAMSAVWISLGCALLVPIGARLYSLRVGILAAAIAALLPPLVAHGQIVGHESPTVLWWSLGILLALGVHDATDAAPLTRRTLVLRLAGVGAVVGIAVASRFVNGLLGPLCALIVVARAPRPWRRETLQWGAAVMPVVAVLVVYLVWPRLWAHPIAALQASLAKLTVAHSPEPFLGTITNAPGRHYFLVYLLATLPVGVLAGVVAWLVRLATARRAPAEATEAPRGRLAWLVHHAARLAGTPALIVLAWFVIPLAVALSPVRQDGVRYVMPCVTALALMAAAGVDGLAMWLARARAFPALGAVLVGYLALTLVRVHPYYLDYFGEQVGGAGTVAAHRWFETAWWGEGVDRAVAYVNAHAAPGAVVHRDCVEPGHLAWFREDLWAPMTHDVRAAAWIVSYAPATHRCAIPPDARKVYAVTSGDLVLAEVYQRDPAPPR